MADTDNTPRFRAGGQFWLDLTFDDPYPPEAEPWAQYLGPTDREPSRVQGLNISNNRAPHPSAPGDPRKIRITGQIPDNAPPGEYQLSVLVSQWGPSASPTWHQVPIDFAHIDAGLGIFVDPKQDAPPQPPIPKLTGLN